MDRRKLQVHETAEDKSEREPPGHMMGRRKHLAKARRTACETGTNENCREMFGTKSGCDGNGDLN